LEDSYLPGLGRIHPSPLKNLIQLKINFAWQKIPVKMIINWSAAGEVAEVIKSAEEAAVDYDNLTSTIKKSPAVAGLFFA